jgi:hypothetical protein
VSPLEWGVGVRGAWGNRNVFQHRLRATVETRRQRVAIAATGGTAAIGCRHLCRQVQSPRQQPRHHLHLCLMPCGDLRRQQLYLY